MSWNFLDKYGGSRGRSQGGLAFWFLNDRISLLLLSWEMIFFFLYDASIRYVFFVTPNLTLFRKIFTTSPLHCYLLLVPPAKGHRFSIPRWFLHFGMYDSVDIVWEAPVLFLLLPVYSLVISAADHCWIPCSPHLLCLFCRFLWGSLQGKISAAFGSTYFNLESGVFSAYLFHWKWWLFPFPLFLWMIFGSRMGKFRTK